MGVVTQTGAAWHAEIAPDSSLKLHDPISALPLDECWGHPYNTQYHYHAYSWKCFPDQGDPSEHSPLFGYAIDGFGVYGPRGENGVLVTNDDLDECHGHTHVIEWDGVQVSMYHYHVNNEYPYCHRLLPRDADHAAEEPARVATAARFGPWSRPRLPPRGPARRGARVPRRARRRLGQRTLPGRRTDRARPRGPRHDPGARHLRPLAHQGPRQGMVVDLRGRRGLRRLRGSDARVRGGWLDPRRHLRGPQRLRRTRAATGGSSGAGSPAST